MEIASLILEYIKALIWPITTIFVLIYFRSEVSKLFERAKKLNLPGGFSVEAFDEKIEQAKHLGEKIVEERKPEIKEKIHKLNDFKNIQVNRRMIELGLEPSPSGLDIEYYKQIAERDPRLALAGLRIDFEMMLKNLAKGFKVNISSREPIRKIINKLLDTNSITYRQYDLLNTIFEISNYAIHGKEISTKVTLEVLDISKTLIDDYKAWLTWGFSK